VKLGSVLIDGLPRLVCFQKDRVIDLNSAYQSLLAEKGALCPDLQAAVELPSNLVGCLELGTPGQEAIRAALDFAAEKAATGPGYIRPEAGVTYQAPHRPPKIVCTGTNYEDYRIMIGMEYSPVPLIFLKSSTATIGHEEAILLPEGYGVVYHEWEFSCVIGKKCKNVPKDEVDRVIFGYTILNDLTGRSLEAVNREFQPWGKNCDTFAPFGPWIATPDELPKDIYNLKTIRRRNGKVECESNTSNMHFGFGEIIEFASSFMTLYPGDIITTATPPAGTIEPGDMIEAEIEGIGILRNRVEAVRPDPKFAKLIDLDVTAI
jgi:2-keto-4-pentenoate hydratase/2-oxohepta-3-ene-1,7-dioic acid hydratase in catechol pathway